MGIVTTSSETAFSQSPEVIYDFVTNPANWTKTYPHSTQVGGLPETLPLKVGDTWTESGPDAEKIFTWHLAIAMRPKMWVFNSVGHLGHDPDGSGGMEGRIIRESFAGELGDLELLRSQLCPGLGCSTPSSFTGGSQLSPRLNGATHLPQGIESLGSLTKRDSRLGGAALPAQPGSERQLRSCSEKRPSRGPSYDCELKKLLRRFKKSTLKK